LEKLVRKKNDTSKGDTRIFFSGVSYGEHLEESRGNPSKMKVKVRARFTRKQTAANSGENGKGENKVGALWRSVDQRRGFLSSWLERKGA